MKNKKLLFLIPIILIMSVLVILFIIQKIDNNKMEPGANQDAEYIDGVKNSHEYLEDEDQDKDGLSNLEEKKLGTNVSSRDTDKDGLFDFDEINKYKTNPKKKDTDNDTINDGNEIQLGLNPLKIMSDGKTKDSKRKFDITFQLEDGSLEVSGNGQIAGIYADTAPECNVDNVPGVLSELYEFYMEDMKFDSAKLTIHYDEEKLKACGCTEEDIAIYQFTNYGKFKQVGGTVDEEKNTITTNLKHFSKYVVANKKIIGKSHDSQVFILLDNSGSMYSNDVNSAYVGNDVEFKRVDMAKQLIEMTKNDDISYGLAKFTGTYTELASGFQNSKDTLFTQLDSIKTTPETFNGTYIANSIKSALNNFDEETMSSRRYILLLTDGRSTEGLWKNYDEDDAIRDANRKNVSIIVIGLGRSLDSEYLNKIARETNGAYVHASNSDALDTIYNTLITRLNYNFLDANEDGVNDSLLLADSGFDITKHAFSFNNYYYQPNYDESEICGGQCAGMATFVQLYYKGLLPLKYDKIDKYQATGLWFINRHYLQADAYDLSTVDFFAKGGTEYASNRRNLKELVLFPQEQEIKKYKKVWDRYEINKSDSSYLQYNQNIKDLLDESPLFKLRKQKTDKTCYVKKDGSDYPYNKFDSYFISTAVDYDNLSKEYKDAYHVLMAIHNFYAQQGLEDKFIIYDILDSGNLENAEEDTMYQLISTVNNGNLPIVSGEGHAINLVRVYRDMNNPMIYKFEVYDNNNCNKTKVLTVKKIKYTGLSNALNRFNDEYFFEIMDDDNIFQRGENQEINVNFKLYKDY